VVKILVVGDLHGKMPRIHFKDFDYIIQVGDVCSDKLLRPLYKKYFQLVKKLKDDVPNFDAFVNAELGVGKHEKILEEETKVGRRVLEYLNSFGVPVFFVPGNWDNSYGPTKIKDMDKNDYTYWKTWLDWWLARHSNEKLVQGLENIYDLQFGLYSDKFNVLGFGLISGPERLERVKKLKVSEEKRKKLKEYSDKIPNRLSMLWKKRDKKLISIFISHNVPYGVLDKVIDKNNYANGKHAGSTVARNFCLRHKPDICIGGHIHEHYGRRKLGKTVVINSGFGRDAQVLIDINEKTKKFKTKFVDSVVKKYRKKG